MRSVGCPENWKEAHRLEILVDGQRIGETRDLKLPISRRKTAEITVATDYCFASTGGTASSRCAGAVVGREIVYVDDLEVGSV